PDDLSHFVRAEGTERRLARPGGARADARAAGTTRALVARHLRQDRPRRFGRTPGGDRRARGAWLAILRRPGAVPQHDAARPAPVRRATAGRDEAEVALQHSPGRAQGRI